MKKGSKKSGSKSQAIRDYKAAHPDAKPKAIVAALAEMKITVTPATVSTTLSMDKRKSKKTRKSKDNSSTLETLIQAKKMADQMGGVAKAREALNALAKILG